MSRKNKEKTKNDTWLAQVEIKKAINGKAQIYIDGRKVNGVVGYKVEQNSQEKRVPILELQIQCEMNLETGAVPLLPEPWSWFYEPKSLNFVGSHDFFIKDKSFDNQ
ncbi:MAG: hypothetical protein ACERKN_07290 [Velocimicrobium sp.]